MQTDKVKLSRLALTQMQRRLTLPLIASVRPLRHVGC